MGIVCGNIIYNTMGYAYTIAHIYVYTYISPTLWFVCEFLRDTHFTGDAEIQSLKPQQVLTKDKGNKNGFDYQQNMN